MIKSYKVRLYPTQQQESQMWQHIGACRFMWNYMLAYQKKLYETGGKHLSAFDMMKAITALKNDGEHSWLKEVSNASLQTVCRDLDKAYKSFFKKTKGFPKFKSKKRSKLRYPIRADRFYFENGMVKIEKLGKVKYKTDFTFPEGRGNKFTNPRISFVNGKWMLSFGMECESQAPVLNEQSMGIDLGVKDLAIAAYGDEKLVFIISINLIKCESCKRDSAIHSALFQGNMSSLVREQENMRKREILRN